MQGTQALPRAALVRALGFAPVWLLIAMATPATSRLALPVLVIVIAWSAWRSELDLATDFDAIEFGMFAFAAAWIVAAVLGIDPGRSLRMSVPMLTALTAFFVLRRQKRADEALVAFDTTLFVLGLWQCLQLLRPLWSGLGGEAATQASDALWLVEPNDLAWIAASWPPLLARREGGRGRWMLWGAIGLGIVLMIVLGSRLALAVAVLALAPMLARSPRHGLAVGLGLLALIAIAALTIGPEIFGKGTASLGSRAQLWQAAWQVFLAHPLTGVGPHNFELAYIAYLPEAQAIDPRITPWPHSLPLELAASTGLTGMFAGVLVICAALYYCLVAPPLEASRRRVLFVQCAVFCMLALFEASFMRLWVWMLATSILCRLPLLAAANPEISLNKGDVR